jgi:hypothetical protein
LVAWLQRLIEAKPREHAMTNIKSSRLARMLVHFAWLITAVTACKKTDAFSDLAPHSSDIGTTGYVVELPNAYTLSPLGGSTIGRYRVNRGEQLVAMIDEVEHSAGSMPLDIASTIRFACLGRVKTDTGPISTGGSWYACTGTTNANKEVTTRVGSIVPRDGRPDYIDCHFQAPNDTESALSICKSIHKK